MIRDRLRNEIPEIARMIEMLEMTELMHDDVVGDFGRQMNEFVREIQISFARTAPPSSGLVSYRNAIERIVIVRVEMCETLMNEYTCSFFMVGIIIGASGQLRS